MKRTAVHLLAWARSAEFRAIARRQCQKMNAEHARKPRCSATAKSTGERCGNAAMPNGVCWAHGGKTPKGDKWHLPRWPDRNAPNAAEKADRKAKDLQKRARKREKHLARRSPEELAAHEAWQRTHQPGPAKRREALRAERRQNAEARAAIVTATTMSPAAAAELRAIDARRVELEALIAAIDEAEIASNWTKGVFG